MSQSEQVATRLSVRSSACAHVGRRIERLRDGVDDPQLALGVHTSVTTGRIIGRRRVRSYTNEFSVSRTLPTR